MIASLTIAGKQTSYYKLSWAWTCTKLWSVSSSELLQISFPQLRYIYTRKWRVWTYYSLKDLYMWSSRYNDRLPGKWAMSMCSSKPKHFAQTFLIPWTNPACRDLLIPAELNLRIPWTNYDDDTMSVNIKLNEKSGIKLLSKFSKENEIA